MRIPMSCQECFWDEFRAQEEERLRAERAGETVPNRPPYKVMRPEDWYLVDLDDSNAYIKECRNRHTIRVALQNVRYEVLFESGMVAMLMGFYRESVSSIAAALERFYEFAIQVFTHRAVVSPEEYDKAWKLLNRSELQLGAFQVLYLTNFNRPFLNSKEARKAFQDWTTFRNDVTHNGVFPTNTQARDYAKYVYEVIRTAQRELRKLDDGSFQWAVMRHIRSGKEEIERRVGPPQPDSNGLYHSSGRLLQMMLNTVVQGGPEDFESRLAQTRENLWLWGFPEAPL